MQTKLASGKAAFRTRRVGLSLAISALIAAFALCAPDQALAACGGATSHAAGIHAAGSGGGGVHVASVTAAPRSAAGGGVTSGCATGASASAIHGLSTAASGRVVETGAHASRPASSAKTMATRIANTGAHMHAIRATHHG
jgi:hypothetical protein